MFIHTDKIYLHMYMYIYVVLSIDNQNHRILFTVTHSLEFPRNFKLDFRFRYLRTIYFKCFKQ